MPSVWLATRSTRDGGRRYRVMFRVGGRESSPRYGGSFKTKREATDRRNWIAGELANMRVPNLELIAPGAATLLEEDARRWQSSRRDVTVGTATTHSVNLGRILPVLGRLETQQVDVAAVNELVAKMCDDGLARETIRKTKATLAMVLDFVGVNPNPARSKLVKLPAEDRETLAPPTASHVAAVFELLPRQYRLPLLVLDATGMRVGELAGMEWGDVDEPDARWRVRREVSKTGHARWVPLVDFPARPLAIFDAVVELVPREDRDVTAKVFDQFSGNGLRTAITRACKAAGVPAFSPHDLRHRRCTLWQLGNVPAIQGAAWAGHSPTEHAKTYGHAALSDRSELSYTDMLERARTVQPRVIPTALETAI